MQNKVLVTASYLFGHRGRYFDTLAEAGYEANFPTMEPPRIPKPQWPVELAGFRYVIAGVESYTPAVLDQLPDLRVISRAGAGVDAVDIGACSERGIVVTYVPDGNHRAVAEHTLGFILALAKQIPQLDHLVKNGGWTRESVLSVRKKTLGLLGFGRIAQEVGRFATVLGMRVLTTSTQPSREILQQIGVESVTLDQLLADSDFLSIHVPLNSRTRGLINYNLLTKLKPTAYLINTARGPIVIEADLIRALDNKMIAGAALDVFENEPLSPQSKLTAYENVILSPHLSGVDDLSIEDMSCGAVENLLALLAGKIASDRLLNPQVTLRQGFLGRQPE